MVTPKKTDTIKAAAEETSAEPVVTMTPELQAAIDADLAKVNEARASGIKIRTFANAGTASKLYVSDLYELPMALDLDGIAPTSYLAQPEGDITGAVHTQTFSIREERLLGLMFDQPSRRLEQGRALRVVKALKPNGNLVQIPIEGQINNAAAGNPEDAIGVRHYARKGYIILMDLEAFLPVYCLARNCWAAAMVPGLSKRFPAHVDVIGSGYCSYDHMVFVEPNLARNAAGLGMFGLNATTTRSWERNR